MYDKIADLAAGFCGLAAPALRPAFATRPFATTTREAMASSASAFESPFVYSIKSGPQQYDPGRDGDE